MQYLTGDFIEGADLKEQDTSLAIKPEVVALIYRAFNTVTQGIAIYNDALQLEIWNPCYAEMDISHKAALHHGAELYSLYLEFARAGVFGLGDLSQLAQQNVEALSGEEPYWTDLMNIPSTGRSVRIRRYLLPEAGLCFTFDDVTDEIRIEAQLRQTQKMNAIGKLTGGVAHDINNMLAIVTGSLELALDQVQDKSVRRLINTALDASDRGANLTQRLLAFARKQALRPEPVDPHRLLPGLLDMLHKMLGENIGLALQVECENWLCEVDPNQLETAIVNLIVNARDAMPDGGQIRIEASHIWVDDEAAQDIGLPKADYITISILDNGEGMEPMVLERAFEPFFTTKDVGQGTGLGLSMVHGFVKQSGGCARILSEKEKGTAVIMYLPAVKPCFNSSEVVEPPLSVDEREKQVVLLVEDDPVLLEVITVQVQLLGYAVLAAADGERALDCLRENTEIKLLLTDVMLSGGMNGRELSEQAVQIRKDLQVVFMSGYSDDVLTHENSLDTDLILLQKPFKQQQLAEALNYAVERGG
ncbi:MAG: ATP-binding protein [Amphritea sp.]|nr:ATP-binding protein [Amphritea sp.]